VTIVSLLGGGPIEFLHAGDDDAACEVPVLLHDHDAHDARIGADKQTTPPDHCYVCHWLRSIRSISLTVQQQIVEDHHAAASAPLALAPSHFLPCEDVPARAPPARLLKRSS
jgi:hypothetical protein